MIPVPTPTTASGPSPGTPQLGAGPTLTVKLSGSLLDPDGIDTLAAALDALNHRAPAARVVLVHGGGPQLDAALARLDEPTRTHDGLRVTTPAQVGIVQATLDQVGHELATALAARGPPAEHVSSIEQRLVATVKRAPDGTDLGRVGTPVTFRTHRLPGPPAVPVVTPVGTDGADPLNVNADEAAATIAAATGSDALVLATDVPGVLDAHGTLLERLTPDQADQLVADGTAADGMQPKLAAATDALQHGVGAVHVTDLDEATLANILADPPTGPGTRITHRPEVHA